MGNSDETEMTDENFGQAYIDECNDWRGRMRENAIEMKEASLPPCECGGDYIWCDTDINGKSLFSCDVCGKDYIDDLQPG